MHLLKDKLQLRLYQQTILNTASQKNTLVVLPTGLGKTHIAAALASLRLAHGKILFLAPTKPLVAQHLKTFSEIFEPKEGLTLFTGETKADSRKELWEKSKIIFSTPQTIKNDLISGKVSFDSVALLVLDEAHRATGEYAYTFLAREYAKLSQSPRILALTASPGKNEEKINEICRNLLIEAVEARSREHLEVKSYVKPIKFHYEFVVLPEELENIRGRLISAIKGRLEILKSAGLVTSTDVSKINKKALLALQASLQAQISQQNYEVAHALSVCAALMKLQHALSLIESESVGALKNYFDNLWDESKTSKVRAVKDIVSDFNVRAAYSLTNSALEKDIEHPKLEALKSVVEKQVSEKKDCKILVFTEIRTNIQKILSTLDDISGLEVYKFIGQASREDKGMNQKTQIEVIERFKRGEINCLVCTAVAEEGLDIPSVDLVIFYTPVPSAIRNIQRRGRTGRQEVGKVAVLVTKNTRDEVYYWVSKRAEEKMRGAIQSIAEGKAGMEQNTSTLDQFVKADKLKPEEQVSIFADVRERGLVVDKLFESGAHVTVGTLTSGDFILSEDVGVERKIVNDFVVSLLDGRLFEQVRELKGHFAKPLIILEGNFEDIFKVRQVHPSALWGALASLVLDWGVPILFASNPTETAELLITIAKREQLERGKAVAVRLDQKPRTVAEMQQFLVEGLPAVGPTLAKNLLRHFKSPINVFTASLEDLQKVDGVGEKKAEMIRKILEGLFDERT
ncbi:MAG: DEAD/DEAH box helicase [DPANN group archaeon]|nr:DEAD/DEAH box helicase [DPANN group archaeon]